MTAKRIRCECGRVYEPAKTPACPACGAEANVATAVTPPSLPRTPQSGGDGADATDAQTPAGLPINMRTLVIAGVAIVALVLVVVASRRNGERDIVASEPAAARTEPIVTPTAYAQTSPLPGTTFPQTFDLPAAIASAAPGATIKVPAGFYAGGLTIARPVRILSAGGPVLIQSDGRECLSVRSGGVFVQGVQFVVNGIGDLPAISVAEGAELEMEGCRIQSMTSLGVSVAKNATLKALGTAFTAANGTALRVDQAKANLTQSSFPDAAVGLGAQNGAVVELQSCAFERNGAANPKSGATILAHGQTTSVTATDCHFNSNSAGVLVTEGAAFNAAKCSFKENGTSVGEDQIGGMISARKAARLTIFGSAFERNAHGILITDRSTLEMDGCTFAGNGMQTRQLNLSTVPLVVSGGKATVRNTTIANSLQFAGYVLNGGTLVLEDVEVNGARTAGLGLGDREGAPVRAEIRRSRFQRNGTALGLFAGGSALVENCEIRENDRGILVADRGTQLELRKTTIAGSKEQGLTVYDEARAVAFDSEFRNNARGAQSGMPQKSAARGSLTLEDCVVGANRVFGVGAHAQSELILTRVTFDGTDKTNIFRERSANVQTDAVADASPSPGASDSPPEAEKRGQKQQRRARSTPRPRRGRAGEEEAARILRRLFGP